MGETDVWAEGHCKGPASLHFFSYICCQWSRLVLNREGKTWNQLSCRVQACMYHTKGTAAGQGYNPKALTGKLVPVLSFLLLRQVPSPASVLGNICSVSGNKASLGFS